VRTVGRKFPESGWQYLGKPVKEAIDHASVPRTDQRRGGDVGKRKGLRKKAGGTRKVASVEGEKYPQRLRKGGGTSPYGRGKATKRG